MEGEIPGTTYGLNSNSWINMELVLHGTILLVVHQTLSSTCSIYLTFTFINGWTQLSLDPKKQSTM